MWNHQNNPLEYIAVSYTHLPNFIVNYKVYSYRIKLEELLHITRNVKDYVFILKST